MRIFYDLETDLHKLSDCQIISLPLEYRVILRLLLATRIPLKQIVNLRKEDFDGAVFTLGDQEISARDILGAQEFQEFKQTHTNLISEEFVFDSSTSRWGLTNFVRTLVRNLAGASTDQPPYTPGAVPNVLLIGFPKCGTTWFYEMCRHFPMLDAPRKEICFFSTTDFCRGDAWYERFFDKDKEIRVDISSDYLLTDLALERIKEYAQRRDAQFTFLVFVRRPSSQIISGINHRRKGGKGWTNFDEYLLSGSVQNRFVRNTDYLARLQALDRILGRQRIKVVFQEDIATNAKGQFLEILKFINPKLELSVIEKVPSGIFNRKINKGLHVVNFPTLRFLTDLDGCNRLVFGNSFIRKAITYTILQVKKLLCYRGDAEPGPMQYKSLLNSDAVRRLDESYTRLKEEVDALF